MNRTLRLLAVVALAASGLVVTTQPAVAAVDASCTFAKAKKLVTFKLPADDHDEGDFLLGRVPGSKRIGFDSDDFDWKVCGSATVENANKIKVVGSQQSETLVVTLDGGMLGPGAANEANGAAEIEIVGDMGNGTDTLVLLGGDGNDRLGVQSRTQASFNGDNDSDVNLDSLEEWRMYGGRGSDVLDGRGAPSVYSQGQEGGDRVIGGRGEDNLYGDEGEEAADGNDVLIGGAGDDDLNGGGGADELLGGPEDDDLEGEKGNDVLKGQDGNDYIYCSTYTDGRDDISGGPGDDDVGYYTRSKPLKVSLDGKRNDGAKGEKDLVRGDIEDVSTGSKADVIIGNNASNVLDSGLGNDVLKGLGGNDSFYADEGDDTVFGGSGDDSLRNAVGQDKYFGEAGDDYLDAGGSNDGRDVYAGGPGDDQIDYSDYVVPLTIDVTDENGDGAAGEGDYVHADFERIVGGASNDLMTGGGSAENLYGYNGNDTIDGGRGSDQLFGSNGNDDLNGGEGRDYVYGEANDDVVFLAGDDAYDYGDCGSGTDTIYVDAYDSNTSGSCESAVA